MTGMKEKLGEEKYKVWYARHRVVENERVWKLKMAENPMNTIPDFKRVLPPTYSLEEAFFHVKTCTCGSCVGEIGILAKAMHREYFPDLPWVRGASTDLPPLPRQVQELLRSVEKQVLSHPDPQS